MNLRSGSGRRAVEVALPDDNFSGSEHDYHEGDEGEDDGMGRDIRNPPGHRRNGQPHFNNRKFRSVLTDASQFKRYWQKLASHFYGCGPEFSKYWFKALEDEDDDDPNPEDDDTNARRVAWETIFNSLADKLKKQPKSKLSQWGQWRSYFARFEWFIALAMTPH